MSGGGSGSIDRALARDLCINSRDAGLDEAADPVRIYYHLAMDRVHYVPQQSRLYFTNSKHYPVLATILAVYQGAGETPVVEQLFLDEHGYYKGAQCIKLAATCVEAVLVALRLKGIKISVARDLPATVAKSIG